MRYGPGIRCVKSRTPWRPGFTPVTSDVHAGEVAAGIVERSRPQAPSVIRRASTGSRPAAAQGPTRSSVAPSSPMTRSGVFTTSVDVAERLQPLLGGRVGARLLGGARVCARLQDRAPELGTHHLR